MNNKIKQQIWLWTRGFGVLSFAVLGMVLLMRAAQPLLFQTAQVGHDMHRVQGQFDAQNLASVPSSLAPAYAASGEEKLEFAIADTPYMPDKSSTDDYHCFVIDAVRVRNMTVTGIEIKPDNKRIVHHAILFKLEGDVKREALEKNRASGGQGWTCFGGPGVGGPTTVASAWSGAWVPGAGEGHFPDGVGVSLPKDAVIVMQMHYNLNNGIGQDRSSVVLNIAPEGKKLTELKAQLQFAPIEIPCAEGSTTPACDREAVIRENTTKFGVIAGLLPGRLLSLCGQKLEQYQEPVADAKRVTSTKNQSRMLNA